MKKLALSLLAALTLIASAPSAGASVGDSNAPRALLIATDGIDSDFQNGRVIYSTWDGEHFDRSKPPIQWPSPLIVPGASVVSVRIPTSDAPFVVEVRAWEKLSPSGKPRGKPEVSECGPPTTSGTAGTCTLVPRVTTTGTVEWEVRFDLVRSSGPYYLAISAAWPDAQVAWINHLELTD